MEFENYNKWKEHLLNEDNEFESGMIKLEIEVTARMQRLKKAKEQKKIFIQNWEAKNREKKRKAPQKTEENQTFNKKSKFEPQPSTSFQLITDKSNITEATKRKTQEDNKKSLNKKKKFNAHPSKISTNVQEINVNKLKNKKCKNNQTQKIKKRKPK